MRRIEAEDTPDTAKCAYCRMSLKGLRHWGIDLKHEHGSYVRRFCSRHCMDAEQERRHYGVTLEERMAAPQNFDIAEQYGCRENHAILGDENE